MHCQTVSAGLINFFCILGKNKGINGENLRQREKFILLNITNAPFLVPLAHCTYWLVGFLIVPVIVFA